MKSKIQSNHTARIAYVYLRQSTMSQVTHHQESTERQYALQKRAFELGWPKEKIQVLDADLGLSGTQMMHRKDFKTLVADVSMNKVGAIFALEVSRLSRSNTDWYRLLELCALTDTLIIDEDGCYDPKDFNDQLLLGLKGTMSQAELHFLRARLQGGKLNKAKKGELKIPLPTGLSYDSKRRVIFDRSEKVCKAVRLVFTTFRKVGSAYSVVRWFRKKELKFPKRIYGGKSAGKLIWGNLSYARVLGILRNPLYAGVYAYGRHHHAKTLTEEGHVKAKKEKLPIAQWKVNISKHHASYITWKEFLENQEILAQNRTNAEGMVLSGAAREGAALLQGLLLCKICGRKLTVRYTGNKGIYPCYECLWLKKDGLSDKICILTRADLLDGAVAERVLEIVQPEYIEKTLASLEKVDQQYQDIERQWKIKIEKAEQETQLAQKRYEEADPSNRMVASTLESRWNDAMINLEHLREEHSKYQQKKALSISSAQKKKIVALAKKFPRLWKASYVRPKERKRILRLLIKDITVEKNVEEQRITLYIRWQGGQSEHISVDLPQKIYDRVRYSDDVVDKIRDLAPTLSDKQIARKFNEQGMKSAKGKPFTASKINWIKRKHKIPTGKRLEDEFTVREAAKELGVSIYVIYGLIEQGLLKARRMGKRSPFWVKLDKTTKSHLLKKIKKLS